MEVEPGLDEQVGAPCERRARGDRLEHAHRGRPDREHRRGGLDPLPGLGLDLVALAVELVILGDPGSRP